MLTNYGIHFVVIHSEKTNCGGRILESRFEAYLLAKASTEEGTMWLSNFKRGGLQTIALVIHFLYDRAWMDEISHDQEEELINALSKVKVRVFKQLELVG